MKQHFKFSENPCICSDLSVHSDPHNSLRGLGEKCEKKVCMQVLLSSLTLKGSKKLSPSLSLLPGVYIFSGSKL